MKRKGDVFMNTHQNLMVCEREVLLKHIRFTKQLQNGAECLDVTSLTSLSLVNNVAYGVMQDLFDKHGYDTIIAMDGDDLLYAQPMALRASKNLMIARDMSGAPYNALCETYPSGDETRAIELEDGRLDAGNKVLIVSTMLTTRQETAALVRLIQRTGAHIVGIATLVSLDYLAQAEIPDDVPVRAILRYGEPPR